LNRTESKEKAAIGGPLSWETPEENCRSKCDNIEAASKNQKPRDEARRIAAKHCEAAGVIGLKSLGCHLGLFTT